MHLQLMYIQKDRQTIPVSHTIVWSSLRLIPVINIILTSICFNGPFQLHGFGFVGQSTIRESISFWQPRSLLTYNIIIRTWLMKLRDNHQEHVNWIGHMHHTVQTDFYTYIDPLQLHNVSVNYHKFSYTATPPATIMVDHNNISLWLFYIGSCKQAVLWLCYLHVVTALSQHNEERRWKYIWIYQTNCTLREMQAGRFSVSALLIQA